MEEDSKISIIPKIIFFWYITIFISTEVLSSLNLINRSLILLVNILFLIIIIVFFGQGLKKLFYSLISSRKVHLFIISAILGLTFFQGFLSAPNTTDSMVRRLPIVMYWVQEQTLYQDIIRNGHDFMGPFSEYIFLHLYLIFNGDRMLFFSQWIAYAVTIILSFLIALKLSSKYANAVTICLLVASLPMAVLQGSSVQMDMVLTVMVLFSIYFAFIFKESPNIVNALFLSFAIGLGILTKATYLIYVIFPAGIIFPLFLRRWKKILVLGILIIIVAFVVQGRFVEQNLRLYGSISGEKGKSVYMNELITLPIIASNLIKNLVIQFPFPIGKNIIEQVVIDIHKKLGVEINDPRINFFDVKFSVNPVIFPQEDRAGSPVHLIIILIAGVILLVDKNRFKDQKMVVYTYFLSIASFVLFSTALRWQPYHSRLLMPFFIMGSITSIIIFSEYKKLRRIINLTVIISVVLSILLIICNTSKPYFSYNLFYSYVHSFIPPLSSVPQSIFSKKRDEQYFNARFYWYDPYRKIVILASEENIQKTIAFDLMDEFEYPLWYLLKENKSHYKVVPLSKKDNKTIIISTSKEPYYKKGYITRCVKTDIEYGYACLSKK